MINYYEKYNQFYMAVDCIIFGFDNEELKILLIKRDFEPCRGEWSLMGGFLSLEEDLDDAAQRILTELTGLKNVFLEQLYTYGEKGRDTAGRVISTAYYALIKTEKYDETLLKKHHAAWFSLEKIPDLVFDHNRMVEKALKRLRRKSRIQPVGFELLPEKFTLPQLQKLYEAIHGEEFDKRNFRKKILSFGVLKKLDQKEKETSRKGAFLYTFNRKKYESLVSEGNQLAF
ncbi:MAG: NUDIX hydrolase [Bacteroidales bacterium]